MGLSRLKPDSLVRRQAIRWLVRLRGNPSALDKTKFDRWYASDRRHADAFELERERFDKDYGLLRSSSFAADLSLEPRARPRSPVPRFALAAGFAALLVFPLGLLLIQNGGFRASPTRVMMLVSQVGEIRSVTLPDGSHVTLDTQSAVRVEVGPKARRARLERGRARFSIQDGPIPFIVTSGATRIVSRDAILDVDRLRGPSHIEVRSGSAAVKTSRMAQSRITAGKALDAGPKDQHLYAISSGDWTSGMLNFEASPLIEVVRTANLYSKRRIRLADPSLGRLKVSGVYHANDTEGLTRALAHAFGLEVRRTRSGDLVLSLSTQKKEGG